MNDVTPASMRWASALSTAPSLPAALDEIGATLRSTLGGVRPDLALVFVSAHHQPAYARVPEIVADQLGATTLVGCSAGGVIGAGREVEDEPAVSVTAAVLPEVSIHPFHVVPEAISDPASDEQEWQRLLGFDGAGEPQVLIIADPFTADAERFVRGLDRALPGSRVVGGLASGGMQPGGNALYVDDRVHRGGIAGVALGGDIVLDTIVAQGCRPIGEPMFVTSAQENVLYALDGRPAVTVLQELYRGLRAADQALCRQSLFLGIAMHDARERYRQGDFLVRNIVGIDAAAGALAVGAELRAGMIVQFHLRDARTSADDLEALLTAHERQAAARPAGSVLFSCLGRGTSLYGRRNHDSDAFRRHLGDVPLGGFFCNGEIGPVHGTTFVHGYTSAFGLFRRRS
jgi:small ligand-binding sensory domain FIST